MKKIFLEINKRTHNLQKKRQANVRKRAGFVGGLEEGKGYVSLMNRMMGG